MKKTLEKWKGKFLVNHEVKDNLKDVKFKNGEEFHIRLLAKRKTATYIAVVIMSTALISSIWYTGDMYSVEASKRVTDSRPVLAVIEKDITGSTGDIAELGVSSKESVMHKSYPVTELTEEDIKEIEYYDSLELLAICVEAEAGNQDFYGKCLVVDVILNRVDSDRFPNDITSVITQDYQFSSVTDGNMDKVWEPSEETYKAVKSELMDRTDYEVLFFTEGRYNPYCIPMFKYGAHYFGR